LTWPEGLRKEQVLLAEPPQVCLTWVNTNHSAQINQAVAAVVISGQASLVCCSGAAGRDPSPLKHR